jgi:hypothetical protein
VLEAAFLAAKVKLGNRCANLVRNACAAPATVSKCGSIHMPLSENLGRR